jgi:hypothetical protein
MATSKAAQARQAPRKLSVLRFTGLTGMFRIIGTIRAKSKSGAWIFDPIVHNSCLVFRL